MNAFYIYGEIGYSDNYLGIAYNGSLLEQFGLEYPEYLFEFTRMVGSRLRDNRHDNCFSNEDDWAVEDIRDRLPHSEFPLLRGR